MVDSSQDKPEKEKQKQLTFQKAFVLALEFGFIIVIPLLIFGYLGKWLDARYHNKLFLVGGILLAFLISTIWFYKRIMDIYNDLKNL